MTLGVNRRSSGPLLTCVGPSRDLRNVNNAASVQLCAAFLLLPGVWGENGGSFHHIYPAPPSPLSSSAVSTRSPTEDGALDAFLLTGFTLQSELFSLLLSHGKLRLTFLGRGVVV